VKKVETPHTNKDGSSMPVLILFFTEIFQLLVEETNLYEAYSESKYHFAVKNKNKKKKR
jgi:hypothetical protein